MHIDEAAKQLRTWAAQKGILSYNPPEDEGDVEVGLTDISNATQAAEAEQILHKKKINLIGVNDETETIIIYTHRQLTRMELAELPEITEGGFAIDYRKASPPVVKNVQSGGLPAGPCEVRNQFYTCGSSIYVGNSMGAGTLGCLVRNKNGQMCGLSNNHVTGAMGYAERDLPVVAPGGADVAPGNPDPFTLGHHTSSMALTLGTPDNADVSNNIDAALFLIKDENHVSSMQRSHFDTPSTVSAPRTNMVVEKVGRTTNRTKGHIIARAVAPEPVSVNLPGFRSSIYFQDFYVVEGINQTEFSQAGDSGSLVCFRPANGEPAAVGIIFAGTSGKLSYMAPLDKVLNKFGVGLITGHNVN